MLFLDCPAYLDDQGALRCGLPAEVRSRFIMRSSDGPLEAAMIRCPSGHWFNGPIESLTWEGKHQHEPGNAAAAQPLRTVSAADPTASVRARATAGSPTATAGETPRYACLGREGGAAVRHVPGQSQRAPSRPTTAPAYYLGRPAWLWISAMTPRRTRQPLAVGQTRASGQDQPHNPAGNTQPEPSRAQRDVLVNQARPGLVDAGAG